MDRRKFNGTLLVAAVGSQVMKYDVPVLKKTILPTRLQAGDLIGLIAPAGVMNEQKIKDSIEKFESYGFRIKAGKSLESKYGYLAGSDEDRLEDLHEMYRDPTIKGIWCGRGGYGITRILDKIDYKLIKKNPKVLIGFSDITALLNAIYQKTGIVGFHGPLGASVDNSFTREILRDLVMHPDKKVEIEPYYPVDTTYDDVTSMLAGQASGIAVGGNLSLMAAMAGTEFEIKCRDKIVFIEDVGEEPYRIDRMLTQLIQATDLSSAKGIVLGQFKGCNPSNPERSLSLLDCLKDRLLPLGLPCIYGLNFGHVAHNFTFPIGGMVEVNFTSGKIAVKGQMVG